MATTGTIGRVSTSRPTLSKLPMSREEFSALGDTKHHEYYDGMCIVNPPQRRHVRAEIRLLDLLRAVCPPAFEVLMEWGWQTGASIFEPDLMVVPADGPVTIQRDPPMLVVEVLSPFNRLDDLVRKRELYAQAGAPWFWLVDIDAPSITVLQNVDRVFIERQVLTGAGTTVGPLQVEVDPRVLAD